MASATQPGDTGSIAETPGTTRLHDLHTRGGQSPWMDNMRRDYLRNGHLEELIAAGVRGATSNPTIFQKAIEGENDYDDQLAEQLSGHDPKEAVWQLIYSDIEDALRHFAPVYESSEARDGFVSIEVDPALAYDSDGTLEAARTIWKRFRAPNLLVKIPATEPCLQAIEDATAEGIKVNVTLIFGLARYEAVIRSFKAGYERLTANDPATASSAFSVASFFVSRVDTEVDRRLDELAAEFEYNGVATHIVQDVRDLRGRAAVAQASLAYGIFLDQFCRGVRPDPGAPLPPGTQIPLWASTSAKNPAYPDTIYVDNLVFPMTINTMPDATLDAFSDHGSPSVSPIDPESSRGTLEHLDELGVDMDDVTAVLEKQGVEAFARSFDDLVSAVQRKMSGSAKAVTR